MGKRSDGQFERKARDFYPTPPKAIDPLLPHLLPNTRFCEPCAGDGRLTEYLVEHGHVCTAQYDIEPQADGIEVMNALKMTTRHLSGAEMFITNPPWARDIFHPMIARFVTIGASAWFLCDADWAHTVQAAEYMPYCAKIVSVGRVKWEPDSKYQGKDNAAWYFFTPTRRSAPAFYGRTKK